MFDVSGMIQSLAELTKEIWKTIFKPTDERIKDDKYKANKNFKDFMKEVKREESDRKSDLSTKP